MSHRFTRKNLTSLLQQWPQAVSTDAGDFRVLHDLANAGAQGWNESLCWPDYIWLGLESDVVSEENVKTTAKNVVVRNPNADGDLAAFGTITKAIDRGLPNHGEYLVTSHTDCILEIKILESNLARKIANFKPVLPWPRYLRKKLDHTFLKHLRQANNQVKDAKRILGFSDACGVVVFLNEGAPTIDKDMICAYLANAIDKLEYIDAALYLADGISKPVTIPLVTKGPTEIRLRRFHREFMIMLSSFDWVNNTPLARGFTPTNLLAQISIDARSYQMYKWWATGWRIADEPAPAPSLTIEYVPEKLYRSTVTKPTDVSTDR